MKAVVEDTMWIQEKTEVGAVFRAGDGSHRLRLSLYGESVVRVTFTARASFATKPSRIVTMQPGSVACEVREEGDRYLITAGRLRVEMAKANAALTYRDAEGRLLFCEPERGGKWLTAKPVMRHVFDRDTEVELGQSIDGARAAAVKYETVLDREAFEAKLEFVFSEDEALFGLGSHEEGYGNLRGRSRELYQQNMKAVVPHLVSTRGYGVLLDCGSLMTFHDDALGSYWWADVVEELDFYVIAGETYEGVVRGYRQLTGAVPLPPKWAFGYVQSKERYVNAAEVLAVVSEYRRRKVPLDVIVLDWKSWPNGAGWGQKSLDAARFPDPKGFVEELHALHARLMVSIWPIMTGGCENQRELLEAGLMLGNKSTYNAFVPDARERYWQQAERGLFAHGVDAWWCDCTEPFEADWMGALKPEPHVRMRMNTDESKLYLDAGEINLYSLLHSQGIYEGQRAATFGTVDEKRVVNLTRSSYAGQSRYGTISWNGDICATWETLRRCIPEGVNFCATGEPYWTVDAGGFFVRNDPKLWFWRGEYEAGCRGLTDMNAVEPDAADQGCTDLGFHELYTRWLQYAVFLPMFRSHGTDAAREVWRFGEEGSPFYDAILVAIRLRYQLLPYIYSTAAAITFGSGSMMRAVALQFPDDVKTHYLTDQYLFGPSLLVCPVTRPMYYERESRPLPHVVKTRLVYLPRGCGWYDFRDGSYAGEGQEIEAEASLESIPVYAREGSIVVMSDVMQYADEVRNAPYCLQVYTGKDAATQLYEDAGDSYAYERGECAWVGLEWCEERGELRMAARKGSFPGLVADREFRVTFYSRGEPQARSVRYVGEECRVSLRTEGESL